MTEPILKVKKVREDAKLPVQEHPGDSFDLFSAVDITVDDKPTVIKLGLAFDIPEGYQIHIVPRSSLPLKKGLFVANSFGKIDTGYKDEVGLIVTKINEVEFEIPDLSEDKTVMYGTKRGVFKTAPIEIKKGDKICQFDLVPIQKFKLVEVDEIDKTNDRGGGFGSTGEK
jgi:dUTP pyrophosphatase